jgi:hypothetical protein
MVMSYVWRETPAFGVTPVELVEALSQESPAVYLCQSRLSWSSLLFPYCLLAVRRKDGSIVHLRPLLEFAHREHGNGNRSAASHLNWHSQYQ